MARVFWPTQQHEHDKVWSYESKGIFWFCGIQQTDDILEAVETSNQGYIHNKGIDQRLFMHLIFPVIDIDHVWYLHIIAFTMIMYSAKHIAAQTRWLIQRQAIAWTTSDIFSIEPPGKT